MRTLGFVRKNFDNILFRLTLEHFLETIVGTTETPQQQRSVAENIGACRRPHCHYTILYYNQLLLAVQLAAVIPQSLRQQSQGQSSLSGTTQKGIIIPSCVNVSMYVNRNLIKTYHNEANAPLITKIALEIYFDRLGKITIQ